MISNPARRSRVGEGAPLEYINWRHVSRFNRLSVHWLSVPRLPVHRLPVHRLPLHQMPVHRLPVHRLPVRRLPVRRSPVYRLPVHWLPVHRLPVNRLPVNRLPVHRLPVHLLPVQMLRTAQEACTTSRQAFGLQAICRGIRCSQPAVPLSAQTRNSIEKHQQRCVPSQRPLQCGLSVLGLCTSG